METNQKQNVVFTGGGTGGHVFPNQPLIEYYKKNYNVVYFGTKHGMERDIVLPWGVQYVTITSGKLRRYFDVQNVLDILKVFFGIFEALYKLSKIKPIFIFSKGGFVTVPVVVAGRMLGIPVYIHEADMSPGLANRIGMLFASHLFLTFPPKREPKIDYSVSGLPLRTDIYSADAVRGKAYLGIKSNKPILLQLGGSLGASSLNTLLRDSLDQLLPEFEVVHVTGKGKTSQRVEKEGYTQKEFIGVEIFDCIRAADVVVSRAGAGSVMELLTLQKPTLFIPLPRSQSRGDQIENAAYIESFGAGATISEDLLETDIFIKMIKKVYSNREQYIEKIKSLGLPRAEEAIISVIGK
jgi:UDP-N-acetylglucosamine--N-acetylmuramyl-(pentapeptide) pyrophosphoryl-undecaprenol N-acetylglucosamine transferase